MCPEEPALADELESGDVAASVSGWRVVTSRGENNHSCVGKCEHSKIFSPGARGGSKWGGDLLHGVGGTHDHDLPLEDVDVIDEPRGETLDGVPAELCGGGREMGWHVRVRGKGGRSREKKRAMMRDVLAGAGVGSRGFSAEVNRWIWSPVACERPWERWVSTLTFELLSQQQHRLVRHSCFSPCPLLARATAAGLTSSAVAPRLDAVRCGCGGGDVRPSLRASSGTASPEVWNHLTGAVTSDE